MFHTYNYFKRLNDDQPIDDYKEFYKVISNKIEFGGECNHIDTLVKHRFTDLVQHVYNAILRQNPRKILDIGCGNGLNLPQSKLFPEVEYHGVDYAEKTLEVAKKTYPNVKFSLMDAFNLDFPNDVFDIAISSNMVILYPEEKDRVAIIKEAGRVLKDDGILILIVWNEDILIKTSILFSRYIAKLRKIPLPEDYMATCLRRKDVEHMAFEAGLKIDDCVHASQFQGIRESVKYLTLKKYKRTFGAAENEGGFRYSQNIFKDLLETCDNSHWTYLFYYISKIWPKSFSLHSIYFLRKDHSRKRKCF